MVDGGAIFANTAISTQDGEGPKRIFTEALGGLGEVVQESDVAKRYCIRRNIATGPTNSGDA